MAASAGHPEQKGDGMRAACLAVVLALAGCGKPHTDQPTTSYPQQPNDRDFAETGLWLAGMKKKHPPRPKDPSDILNFDAPDPFAEVVKSLAGRTVTWPMTVESIEKEGRVVLSCFEHCFPLADEGDGRKAFRHVMLVAASGPFPWFPMDGGPDVARRLKAGDRVKLTGKIDLVSSPVDSKDLPSDTNKALAVNYRTTVTVVLMRGTVSLADG